MKSVVLVSTLATRGRDLGSLLFHLLVSTVADEEDLRDNAKRMSLTTGAQGVNLFNAINFKYIKNNRKEKGRSLGEQSQVESPPTRSP